MKKEKEKSCNCPNRKKIAIPHSKKFPRALSEYIILGSRIFYFFTVLFLILSIVLLILYIDIGLHMNTVLSNFIFLGISFIFLFLVLSIIKFPSLTFILVVLFIIELPMVSLIIYNSDWFLYAYWNFYNFCKIYTNADILKPIFISMGFINFSLNYIISVRDKSFYNVPLDCVFQEQFPEHGYMFICYTCLILIGLYSCGMLYHIIAFTCLCGALLSSVYTGIIAWLFIFNQTCKQMMVEHYLIVSELSYPYKNQQIEESTSFNRLLLASDYINAYYKANGSIPQTVAGCLWKRLPSIQEQFPITTPLEYDVVICAQMISYVAITWQHILHELPSEQQSELICLVLQTSLQNNSAFLKKCKHFLNEKGTKSGIDTNTHFCAALPLCGLISHLRGKRTASIEERERYWADCKVCLQIIYQIQLMYSHNVSQSDCKANLDTIPKILFLLLETTLLIEISALEEEELAGSKDFWEYLEKMEHSFQQSIENCEQFSDWGFSIVWSYKINWFSSHENMLSAYLTYRRLFVLTCQR